MECFSKYLKIEKKRLLRVYPQVSYNVTLRVTVLGKQNFMVTAHNVVRGFTLNSTWESSETTWRLSGCCCLCWKFSAAELSQKPVIMGKTKAKKRSSFRYRPTGLRSVKEALTEGQENAGTIGVKTLPLVEKVRFNIFFTESLINCRSVT